MSKLVIESNSMFHTEVIARESDEHSELAYLHLERIYTGKTSGEAYDLFMTPTQLETLGRFLIRQADKISTEQANRKYTKA
jgi:hypothetical protein